ncbi:MAG: RNA 3'-terminal phosphate cyclase [Phycisphaerae bacterium]|nr:RNA 3'-terminal phosphate cyclase [Phycisphaerae bacterium]NIR62430.1 RNA 3'-terminal phosphate cyclase [candidate division Zixibacteria bacterium]NIP55799.1 RNA 3'-terminal phosphate cyclase [Phycisphaerae bacterium]NIS50287.1 RNA 3'-terminal phosphate cyclase [Phycisphaerae bacterium]NIU08032.1 RNA 3'-terminal phosphate cyclase [Phycisphaerae bacterium]
MDTVFIDGSTGEGGGQILRTSLTLSCITGRNLHIENIRAARRNPGLANQHLSCVRAACQICNGQSQGATKGSQVLDFQPGPIRSGDYHFDIGSAGSASLVIQTLLPALFLTGKPSTVTVIGGTHNPMAPPFDFLDETFLPAIVNAGFNGICTLLRHGFFPAGGGKITFNVLPWQKSTDQIINLCQPVRNFRVKGRIYTARLPVRIAQRQRKLLLQSKLNIKNTDHIEVEDSDGPGNCVMIRLCGSERTTVFTAFGQRGKPSEEVINEVVNLAENFLACEAAVDRFLADQLLIYMALAQAGSFTTNELSSHLQTNMEVIKEFLPVDFNVEHQEKAYRITCKSL